MEPPKEPTFQLSDFIDARQERIYRRLATRISEGTASFYRDVCRLRNNSYLFNSTTHLTAHLLRDIESALRDVVLPHEYQPPASSPICPNCQSPFANECPTCGSTFEKEVHKAEIEAIAKTYQLDTRVKDEWIRLAVRKGNKPGLHYYAHRDSLAYPRPYSQQMQRYFDDIDAMLDRLLDTLEEKYSPIFQMLNSLLEPSGSVRSKVDILKKNIPNTFVTYSYFFDRLDDPLWLEPLQRKGFFAHPPSATRDDETNNITFDPWPQSRYLARVVKKLENDQQENVILDIVLAFADTDNIYVRQDVVDIALALPPYKSVTLTSKVQNWKEIVMLLLPEKIGEFVAHLAQGGELEQAFALTETLLTSFLNTETSFDTWRYREPLTKLFPALISHGDMDTLQFLCKQLNNVLESSESMNNSEENFSHRWRPAIESHEQNNFRRIYEVENMLVSSVRNAAEQVIQGQKASVQQVVTLLESQHFSIFHRLTLHILRTFASDVPELVVDYLFRRAEFDSLDSHHEYALLIQQCFAQLPLEVQLTILKWIEEGPNVEDYRKGYQDSTKQELDDELVTTYISTWRRDWLSFFSDALPKKWKKRYEKLVAEYGAAKDPQFLSYMTEVGFVSSTSPKSEEELKLMSVKDIVSYFKGWKPIASEADGLLQPSPSQEGLGQALTNTVEADPMRFAEQARQFRGLLSTYVNALLIGFERAARQKRAFLWPSVLDLCCWVVTQHRKSTLANNVDDLSVSNSNWVWSCRIILRLLLEGFQEGSTEIPIDLRSKVWITLRPLTEDSEPTSEDEKRLTNPHTDPSTLAINSVRGDAMHAVVRYAIWVRKHKRSVQEDEQVRASLSEIPEVRKVLNKHLHLEHDSSLAIRSVYGQWFPWLVFLDLRWASQHISKIFPKEETELSLRNAAWEAYIVYSSPFDNVLPVITGEYHRAIDLIGSSSNKRGHPYDPDEHLAEHLMAFYWRGKLTLDEPEGLLMQFFSKASDALRGYALEFVGHSLYREKNVVSEQILARLQALWEQRFKTVIDTTPHNASVGELAAFGWWFSSEKFDKVWALAQLEATLLHNGKVDAAFMIVEYFAKLITVMPLPVLKCLGALIESDKKEQRIFTWHEQVQEILAHAHQSSDIRIQQEAKKIAERLLAQGYPTYLVFTI